MANKVIAELNEDLRELNEAREEAAQEIAAQARALSACLAKKGNGDYDYSECIKALFKLTRSVNELHYYWGR